MNPVATYQNRSKANITAVRVAYWRQAIKATGCPACGAAEGHACRLGQVDDCARCERLARCTTGSRLHQARLDAWLRPAGTVELGPR